MIVLLGDLHGAAEFGYQLIARAKGYQPGAVPIIQVGDIGWHPDRPMRTPPWPIYFIEGNHDHLPSLLELRDPTEVAPNLIYCPRGSVLTLDGRRIAFFGGARSVDRGVREKGASWWPEEEPTFEEAARLKDADVDLLVTHTPPASVVRVMGYPADAEERASIVVESLWASLGRPSVVSGHMHRRYLLGNALVLADMDVDVLQKPRS